MLVAIWDCISGDIDKSIWLNASRFWIQDNASRFWIPDNASRFWLDEVEAAPSLLQWIQIDLNEFLLINLDPNNQILNTQSHIGERNTDLICFPIDSKSCWR